jgi:inosine-uridine nucleoside N-ribohydrolase
LIPIDVCQTIIFTQRDFERIKTISKTGVRLSQIAGCYLDYYQHNPRFGQKEGAIIYDLLVISYLMRSNLFELKPAPVRIKTNQKQNFG